MKLVYHEGANFGDAINPIIFNHYLSDYFDNDETEIFIGIGSIIGLKKVKPKQRAIIFSSGYAAGAESTYGTLPKITPNYYIKCVRGPLTAEILGIHEKYAITDGAILLAAMPHFANKQKNKQWPVSYIPHVGSLAFYNWEKLCNEIGIHYIDPRKDPLLVIEDVKNSNRIMAEAMHGAILADTFRVPWIAIKSYSTVNAFKWKDWCLSMNLEYTPYYLPSVFSKSVSYNIIRNKLRSSIFAQVVNSIFQTYNNFYKVKQVKKKLIKLANSDVYQISDTKVFKHKLNQMLDCIKSLTNNNEN